MLAWHSHVHRGEPQLLDVLINNLREGGHGRRDVAPMLLAYPLVLGLDTATVRRALHSELDTRRSGYPPPSSGAFLRRPAGGGCWAGTRLFRGPECWGAVLRFRLVLRCGPVLRGLVCWVPALR
nr:hypothetical protein [Streptomyces bluensis]